MLNSAPMWRMNLPMPVPTDLSDDEQLESILQHGYRAEVNQALARLLGKEGRKH
jgi:hypothetical protein